MGLEMLRRASRGDGAVSDPADLFLKVHIRLLLARVRGSQGVISLPVTGLTLHKGGTAGEG